MVEAKNSSGPSQESEKKVDNIDWINNKINFNQNWSALPLPLIPTESPDQAEP